MKPRCVTHQPSLKLRLAGRVRVLGVISELAVAFAKAARLGLRRSRAVPAVLLCLPFCASAALVGPTGYTNNFILQPPATDWATTSLSGAGVDTYDPDAQVNVLTPGGIASQPFLDAGNPPLANGNA